MLILGLPMLNLGLPEDAQNHLRLSVPTVQNGI